MQGYLIEGMTEAVVKATGASAEKVKDALIQFWADKAVVAWDVEDVHGECPDLTDEQAVIVLNHVEDNHDADKGINWNTISSAANYLFDEATEEDET
jgi:hypothetical protein